MYPRSQRSTEIPLAVKQKHPLLRFVSGLSDLQKFIAAISTFALLIIGAQALISSLATKTDVSLVVARTVAAHEEKLMPLRAEASRVQADHDNRIRSLENERLVDHEVIGRLQGTMEQVLINSEWNKEALWALARGSRVPEPPKQKHGVTRQTSLGTTAK